MTSVKNTQLNVISPYMVLMKTNRLAGKTSNPNGLNTNRNTDMNKPKPKAVFNWLWEEVV
ncbi:MAG: hypothetical protein ACXWV2_09030 [Chitinophagaceae bacterium]